MTNLKIKGISHLVRSILLIRKFVCTITKHSNLVFLNRREEICWFLARMKFFKLGLIKATFGKERFSNMPTGNAHCEKIL